MANASYVSPKDVKPQKQISHISVLEANIKGKDFIVGDIHGSLNLFKDLLDKVGDHDRLFLVGDLTDRGPQSIELVSTILKFNATRKAKGFPPIFSIRGNHEDLFLDYMNKGKPYDHPLLWPANGGQWVLTATDQELNAIRHYFLSLPYICTVRGDAKSEMRNAGFSTVHALMPMSNQELQQRIDSGNLRLSEFEINFATWARLKNDNQVIEVYGDAWTMDRATSGIIALKNSRTNEIIKMSEDIEFSNIIYCGHEIGKGYYRNHFDLDSGSSQTNMLCFVVHQAKKCELIIGMPLPESLLKQQLNEKNIASTDIGHGKTILFLQKEIQFNMFFYDILRQITLFNDKLSPIEKSNKINELVMDAVIKLHQYEVEDKYAEKLRQYKATCIMEKRNAGSKDLKLGSDDLKKMPTSNLKSDETSEFFLLDTYMLMAHQVYKTLDRATKIEFHLLFVKMTLDDNAKLKMEINRQRQKHNTLELKKLSHQGVFAQQQSNTNQQLTNQSKRQKNKKPYSRL